MNVASAAHGFISALFPLHEHLTVEDGVTGFMQARQALQIPEEYGLSKAFNVSTG